MNELEICKKIQKLFIDYLDLQEKNLIKSGSEITDLVQTSKNKDNLFPVETKINKLHKIENEIYSWIILLNIEDTLFPISDYEEIIFEFKNNSRRVEKMKIYNYYFNNRDGKITAKVNKFIKNKQKRKSWIKIRRITW